MAKRIDDRFILDNYGQLSQRELASHFGVSVSTINRHCKSLGLTGADSEQPPAKGAGCKAKILTPSFPDNAAAQDDDLKRLEDLRDRLFEEIQESKGSTVAKLSKEYRETIAAIRALGSSSEDANGAIADLINQFKEGMPAANVASG